VNYHPTRSLRSLVEEGGLSTSILVKILFFAWIINQLVKPTGVDLLNVASRHKDIQPTMDRWFRQASDVDKKCRGTAPIGERI